MMIRTKLSGFFIGALLCLSLVSTVLLAKTNEQLCNENSQRLQEIAEQLDNNQNCDNLIKKSQAINAAYRDFFNKAREFKLFDESFKRDYEEVLLKEYRALEQESDELVESASEKGFLLTPDKRKGEKILSIFSETSFVNEEDEEALTAMRVKQKEIFTKMLGIKSSASDYSKISLFA